MLTAALFVFLAAPGPSAQQSGAVTFNRDIAPIIFTHCAMCHRPGGDAPFSLLTFEAARQRARAIAAVTAGGQMPPWKGDSDAGTFAGMPPLSREDIDAIERWVQSGMAEGEPRDLPAPPKWNDAWQLGPPDLVVTVGEPYTLRPQGADEYRTFVIPLPVERRRNVIGLEFRPGAAAAVHHANILLDETPRSRELDDRDPAPGYDGPLARTAAYPEGHFLGYTPGRPDPRVPTALAWRLNAGTDLVLQLHLKPTGKPEVIRPSVGLYFTDEAPERVPYLLRLGRQTLNIAPAQQDYRITDSYVMPVDVQLLSIKPHAHYLAREVTAVATFPNGSTKRLLHIPDWDFKWQNVYRFATPVALPRGTSMRVEITYDNSDRNPNNPSHPPREVRWGPATTDEMGDVWIQVLPADDASRAALARDFRPKAAAEEIAGYRGLLEREPQNPVLNDDIAMLYLEVGQVDAAVGHFERSLALRPDSAAALFNLGTTLMMAGRTAEAVTRLQDAVRLKPDFAAAHNNLANALTKQSRTADALSHYVAAVRLQPTYAKAHNGIAALLMEQGNLVEALAHLATAIENDPGLAEAHHNMALVQQARGEDGDAVRHFRDAVRLQPDSPAVLADYAWILATSTVNGVSDPVQSVALAERAAGLTRRADARVLDVLSAAYASAGRFEQALGAVADALKLSPSPALISTLMAHESAYRQRHPIGAERRFPR